MPDPARRAHAAVLHPGEAQAHVDLRHVAAPSALAPWVDYLWCASWVAPRGHTTRTVPRPAVQVVAERVAGVACLRVHGPATARFERHLEGTDRAVAAAFAPAGFRPFTGGPVAALRDRVLALHEVCGGAGAGDPDDHDLAAHLLDPSVPVDDAAATLAARLLATEPRDHPLTAELRDLVERAETDSTLTRAEQLADVAGVSLRTLQRRFDEHVGVGPKWVVQRCRLLDVAAAAHDAAVDAVPVDWAGLAADLGYADQSHLVRAFTRLVGHPPARYTARAAAPPS